MRKLSIPRQRLRLETIALTIILAVSLSTWQSAHAQRSRRGARNTKVTKIKNNTNIGNNFDEAQAATLLNDYNSTAKSDGKQPDITPVRNYYNGLNNTGKQQMLAQLTEKTTQLLEGNNKNDALALTRLYSALAPSNDEKLPTMLYIQGTIYAENLDKNQLQQTISVLEKCKTTPQTEDLLSKLRKNIDDITNYRPPLEKMIETTWVASNVDFSPLASSLKSGYQKTPSLVIEANSSNWTINKNMSPIVQDLNMNDEWVQSQFLYPIGADSIYAVWCSEKISGDQAIMFAPLLRGVAGKVAAEINAEYSQRNKHSFGTEITVGALTTIGEALFNSLIDAIFTPSKKIYTIEAFLKYENDYTMTGTIRYQFAKINAYGRMTGKEHTVGNVTFSRFDPYGEIVFEDLNGDQYPFFAGSILGTTFLTQHGIKKIQLELENAKKRHGKFVSSDDSIRFEIFTYDSLFNTRDFRRYGGVRKSYLPPFGAKYCNVTDKEQKMLNLANKEGVFIKKFNLNYGYGTPYNKIMKNDVIIAINGTKISNTKDLEELMASLNFGDKMRCTVIRFDQQIEIPIWVTWKNKTNNVTSYDENPSRYDFWKKNGTKKNRESWNDDQYKWLVLYNDSVLASHGVKSHLLDNVTPDVGLKVVGIPDKVKKKVKMENGAFVEDVELIGAANVAGIKQKDIIIAINGMTIDTGEDFYYVVRSAKPGDWLNCSILRNNKQISIPIRVTWK